MDLDLVQQAIEHHVRQQAAAGAAFAKGAQASGQAATAEPQTATLSGASEIELSINGQTRKLIEFAASHDIRSVKFAVDVQ